MGDSGTTGSTSTAIWNTPLVTAKKGCFAVRHIQAVILFFGLTIAYSLRVNLSVGIVAMTDNTTNPDFQHVHNLVNGCKGYNCEWILVPATIITLTAILQAVHALERSPFFTGESPIYFFGGSRCMHHYYNVYHNSARGVMASVIAVALALQSTQPLTVNWNSAERGEILSSFFYGYFFTQVAAGQLAAKVGASRPLGVAMIVNGLSTLILPYAALQGFIPAFAARAVQGLGQGFIYPCINTLMSKWAVPQERGRMYSFVFGGTQFGTIIILIAGGLLAASSGGWPSIFYVTGGLSIAWGILCLFFVADSPDKHKTISDEERMFIEMNLISTSKQNDISTSQKKSRKSLNYEEVAPKKPCLAKLALADPNLQAPGPSSQPTPTPIPQPTPNRPSTPWFDMLKSVPLWALLIVHLTQNWGFWTLLTLMPTYISDVLHFDIKKNGFLSALPYFAMWIMSFIFSMIADFLIKKKIVSFGVSRKLWNSIALYGGAVALILLAFLESNTVNAITLLTVAVGINAGTYCGYLANHLDLSPNFAGTLMGITNGFANITSILAPTIAGYILGDEESESQWKTVFLISAGVALVGQTLFNIFGSGEVQPWNSGPMKKSVPEKEPKKEEKYDSPT